MKTKFDKKLKEIQTLEYNYAVAPADKLESGLFERKCIYKWIKVSMWRIQKKEKEDENRQILSLQNNKTHYWKFCGLKLSDGNSNLTTSCGIIQNKDFWCVNLM